MKPEAASDPCSLGIFACLLGAANPAYQKAVTLQAYYMVHRVPRFDNGAISHRYDVAELWSDFIYMVPPFLACLAVTTSDESYLRTAVEQIEKYREVLAVKEGKAKGQWKHIIGPQNEDQGCWSTGNRWAAMGIARVWATIIKWKPSMSWKDESVGLLSSHSNEGEILMKCCR